MKKDTGDKTERWRQSYSRVQKDPLSDPQSTNLERLNLLGLDALPRSARLLDLGTGDGNLFTTLRRLGFDNVYGLEYQRELLAVHPQRNQVVVASATHIPYAKGSMAAVVIMDVLHHLSQAQLPYCISEIRRVLEPGGILYICEPASTFTRKILTVLLMSPLSNLSRFSRDKRTMVEQERDTLVPWLKAEHTVHERVAAGGFRIELFRRCWLHHYGRFRAI